MCYQISLIFDPVSILIFQRVKSPEFVLKIIFVVSTSQNHRYGLIDRDSIYHSNKLLLIIVKWFESMTSAKEERRIGGRIWIRNGPEMDQKCENRRIEIFRKTCFDLSV